MTVAAGRVGGRKLYRWSRRARRDEQRAKTVRTAVVLSLFGLLLTGALVLGGRAAIEPLMETSSDGGFEARREGKIVLTMPDGIYCRHVGFDNATGAFSERSIEQCAHDISKQTSRELGFAWRSH